MACTLTQPFSVWLVLDGPPFPTPTMPHTWTFTALADDRTTSPAPCNLHNTLRTTPRAALDGMAYSLFTDLYVAWLLRLHRVYSIALLLFSIFVPSLSSQYHFHPFCPTHRLSSSWIRPVHLEGRAQRSNPQREDPRIRGCWNDQQADVGTGVLWVHHPKLERRLVFDIPRAISVCSLLWMVLRQ